MFKQAHITRLYATAVAHHLTYHPLPSASSCRAHTYPVHRLAFSIATLRPHVCPLTPGSVIALCGTDCRYPRGPDVRSVLVLVFETVLSRSAAPARVCMLGWVCISARLPGLRMGELPKRGIVSMRWIGWDWGWTSKRRVACVLFGERRCGDGVPARVELA